MWAFLTVPTWVDRTGVWSANSLVEIETFAIPQIAQFQDTCPTH